MFSVLHVVDAASGGTTLTLLVFPFQLEAENAEFKDIIRKLKFEISHCNTTILSLESAKKSMDICIANAKERADRESMSTILAQQRLIAVLNSNLAECSAQGQCWFLCSGFDVCVCVFVCMCVCLFVCLGGCDNCVRNNVSLSVLNFASAVLMSCRGCAVLRANRASKGPPSSAA